MRRRLFTAATVLSLVLCAATTAMWVRSYWVHDVVYRWHPARGWVFSSDRSSLYFMWWKGDAPTLSGSGWQWKRLAHTANKKAFGFESQRQSYISDIDGQSVWQTDRWVWFPYWAALAVTCPLPLLVALSWMRQERRRGSNVCCRCGYDLRATTDRCPECGTPVPQAQRTIA